MTVLCFPHSSNLDSLLPIFILSWWICCLFHYKNRRDQQGTCMSFLGGIFLFTCLCAHTKCSITPLTLDKHSYSWQWPSPPLCPRSCPLSQSQSDLQQSSPFSSDTSFFLFSRGYSLSLFKHPIYSFILKLFSSFFPLPSTPLIFPFIEKLLGRLIYISYLQFLPYNFFFESTPNRHSFLHLFS